MKFSWVIDANAGEKRGKTITAADYLNARRDLISS